jgi:GTP-binding protein
MTADSSDTAPPSGSHGAHDDTPTPDAIEAGRHLFAQACGFLGAAVEAERLPETALPEVAFAGRSNVGKSSLVNALTGRRTLARTSNTPGRTRQLNFFDLGGRLLLVDLPGYGYARASKTDIKQWSALARRYLRGRPALRRVCLLIDARHGAKDSDREIMAELDQAAVSYQAVLTKVDKVKPRALAAVRGALEVELAGHSAAHPHIPVTSARAGHGIAELRAALAALALPAPVSPFDETL